jgi:transcription elongation factor Elf1
MDFELFGLHVYVDDNKKLVVPSDKDITAARDKYRTLYEGNISSEEKNKLQELSYAFRRIVDPAYTTLVEKNLRQCVFCNKQQYRWCNSTNVDGLSQGGMIANRLRKKIYFALCVCDSCSDCVEVASFNKFNANQKNKETKLPKAEAQNWLYQNSPFESFLRNLDKTKNNIDKAKLLRTRNNLAAKKYRQKKRKRKSESILKRGRFTCTECNNKSSVYADVAEKSWFHANSCSKFIE